MNNLPATSPGSGLMAIIDRAASDPNFDIERLQRLLDMKEANDNKDREASFTAAHAAAEAEMETIRADASNPQTRSRYASFAQVDREARPIYTKHGFAISFTTEPTSTPDNILVVGTLSHRQGFSKRFQMPVPITTTGFKGQQMMTPIHATMAAISYGKRGVEVMMFNLQVDADDDGNTRRPAPTPGQNQNQTTNPNQSNMTAQRRPLDITDADSGEVFSTGTVDHVNPCKITFDQSDDWRSWGEKLMWGVRGSHSIEEVDRWALLNQEMLGKLGEVKPVIRKTLQSAIDTVKEGITQA